MSTPKTITFRTDESTFKKVEKLKESLFEGKEISNSEVLRYAIDSLYQNQGKNFYDEEELRNLIQAHILVGFLRSSELSPYNIVDFRLLADVSSMIDEVIEEYSLPEILDVYKLYNDDETITIGKLVRFKYRALPNLFLKVMGDWEDKFESLTDEGIADLILERFMDEDFKKRAEELFGIK